MEEKSILGNGKKNEIPEEKNISKENQIKENINEGGSYDILISNAYRAFHYLSEVSRVDMIESSLCNLPERKGFLKHINARA